METKCEICREIHGPDRGLSFDGKGINSCGMYRSRLLTLMHPNEDAQLAAELVRRYSAHAELVRACEAAINLLHANQGGCDWKIPFAPKAACECSHHAAYHELRSALVAAKG